MVKTFRCIAVAMMDSQVERLWNTGGLAPVVRQKKLLDPLEVESWAMELWKKDMWKSALEEVWFFKMGTWMGEMMVGGGVDDDVLGFFYKGVQKIRKKYEKITICHGNLRYPPLCHPPPQKIGP